MGAGVARRSQQEGKELAGVLLPQLLDAVAGIFRGKVADPKFFGGGVNVVHQKGQHPPAVPVKRQGLGVEVWGNVVHDPAFAYLVKIAVLVLILHLPVGVQRDLRHALPDHIKHIVHIGIIGGHAGAVVRVGGRADAVNVSAQRFRDDLRDAVLTVLPQLHRVDGNVINGRSFSGYSAAMRQYRWPDTA